MQMLHRHNVLGLAARSVYSHGRTHQLSLLGRCSTRAQSGMPRLSVDVLRKRKFLMAGPNVIESEAHVRSMVQGLQRACEQFDVTFIFKASFDKANRTSASSFRGVPIAQAAAIFSRLRADFGVHVLTDIHEPSQAARLADCVDVLQIPAFLCRQTDLLEAAADTGLPVQIKKGQFTTAEAMHKAREKVERRGNKNVILCERGTFFGYHDMVVDPRNLIWMRSDESLVSLDMTHSLQTPSQTHADGSVAAGGTRELVPWMGRLGTAFDVDGLFVEVHDEPDQSKCDAATQWPLSRFSALLDSIGVPRKSANQGQQEESAAAWSPPPAWQARRVSTVSTPVEQQLEEALSLQLEGAAQLRPAIDSLCAELLDRRQRGAVYCSAVGKSQASAMHLSALLKSIGLRAHFLDATNAMHGDLGAVKPGDLLVVFSKSGETAELLQLVPAAQAAQCRVVGVVCEGGNGRLRDVCDSIITTPFARELGRHIPQLPTNSVLSHIVFSNLVASTLSEKMAESGEFTIAEYGASHPSGSIGKQLTTVSQAIIRDVPHVRFSPDGTLSIQDAALAMAAARVGLAIAYESVDGPLLGIVTHMLLRDISTGGRTVVSKSDLRDDFVVTEDGQRLVLDYVGDASFVLLKERQRIVGVLELEHTSPKGGK